MSVPKRRIVLLGKTGGGKSSLGNTIFGEKLFKVGAGFNSKTSFCEAKTGTVNGREITLIDTPGFFDTKRFEEDLKPEIARCITECSPGPHAFLIVLKVDRFTVHEEEIISEICQSFSEEVFKFTTVVFTHGDQLRKGQKIEDFVNNNEPVSDLVKKCGGRCHVIDNKYWKDRPKDKYRSNQYQVEELLKSVEETVKANQGKCYTNEMLQAVEEFIQHKAQRLAKSSGNTPIEEIRENAKSRVYNFLIKATGITTGALIGALFGAAAAVVVVFAIRYEIKTAVQVIAGTAAGSAAAGTAGAVLGTAAAAGAAAGAVYGGYVGYQAAKEAESPLEAVQKAAQAVWSSGIRTIEKSMNLGSTLDKQAAKGGDDGLMVKKVC